MMSALAAEMWEDKHRRIGREHIDGIPLGRTATADPLAPTSSLTEKGMTKNHPSKYIGCGITIESNYQDKRQ